MGLSYSKLIAGLIKAKVPLDRKVLAEIAIVRPGGLWRHREHREGGLAAPAGESFPQEMG